jgi:hypothetical protein
LHKLVAGIAVILALTALVNPLSAFAGQSAEPDNPSGAKTNSASQGFSVYVPIVKGPPPPVMLGLYPQNWWAPTPKDVLENEFLAADDWVGKRSSIAGIFHSLQDTALEGNVVYLMGEIWDCGYTPFVNLYAKMSAADIASGKIDANIKAWAQAYRQYVQDGDRMAFLAPLQEMNGDWVPYGKDPANFKKAFKRIQNIFAEQGVPRESVRWVFAPNGWSEGATFEQYYPGDEYVDVVSFSAYNFGHHPDNPYPKWKTPEQTYGPFLTRMRQLAPGKPIFVAQTGTTAYTASGWDSAEKDEWLHDAYAFLASSPGVRAIVYYNANTNNYDWTIFKPGKVKYSGYAEAAMEMNYRYISPHELRDMDLSN